MLHVSELPAHMNCSDHISCQSQSFLQLHGCTCIVCTPTTTYCCMRATGRSIICRHLVMKYPVAHLYWAIQHLWKQACVMVLLWLPSDLLQAASLIGLPLSPAACIRR